MPRSKRRLLLFTVRLVVRCLFVFTARHYANSVLAVQRLLIAAPDVSPSLDNVLESRSSALESLRKKSVQTEHVPAIKDTPAWEPQKETAVVATATAADRAHIVDPAANLHSEHV